MKKQIFITAALLMSLQVPALAMDGDVRFRVAEEAEYKASHAASEIDLLAATQVQVDVKRKQAVATLPLIHHDVQRSRLPDGRWQETITGYTNVRPFSANKKIENDIKSIQGQKRRVYRKISAEKDALKRSAGSLAGLLLVCMYIHNKGILEFLAERYGPLSAHAVQVFATLALGSVANRMWQAGTNLYSKLPQEIKDFDEKIEDKKSGKHDQTVYDVIPTKTRTYNYCPWGDGRYSAVSADAGSSAHQDGQGAGLGLGSAQQDLQSLSSRSQSGAAPASAVAVDLQSLEHNSGDEAE